MLLGLALVSWSYRPCWCPSPFFLSLHYSVIFHSLFFTCHRISFVFLLYCRCVCSHSVVPSLRPTHFLDEFPGLGLALEQGSAYSRNLVSQFCPGRGLNLGPWSIMAANVTTRLLNTFKVF